MIQHKRVRKKGNGIFDLFKPVASLISTALQHKDDIANVASVAKDVVNVGKNTRDIIKHIRNKRPPAAASEIEDIVKRINKLRQPVVGTGFAYA